MFPRLRRLLHQFGVTAGLRDNADGIHIGTFQQFIVVGDERDAEFLRPFISTGRGGIPDAGQRGVLTLLKDRVIAWDMRVPAADECDIEFFILISPYNMISRFSLAESAIASSIR